MGDESLGRITAEYITDPDLENEIETYFHCGLCMDELPDDMCPRDYARTQMGITEDGNWQVWCNRHDVNIAVIVIRPVLPGDEEMRRLGTPQESKLN